MKEDNNEYIVCCTDLHAALGPYDLGMALRIAERMTKDGDGCIYMPVKFFGDVPVPTRPDTEDVMRHGYL